MQIFLKGLGCTKIFDVSVGCTVTEFKKMIYEKCMIPENKYMLISNGRVLDIPGKKLTDYGLGELSLVELTIRAT